MINAIACMCVVAQMLGVLSKYMTQHTAVHIPRIHRTKNPESINKTILGGLGMSLRLVALDCPIYSAAPQVTCYDFHLGSGPP